MKHFGLKTLGLSLGAAVALGLARFAYAVILPAMRSDLGWSFAQSGGMNTANALGYLLGSLTAQRISRRLGAQRAFSLSIALTALALLASGLSREYGVLLTMRLLAGASGAWAFVTGGGMAARLAVVHGKSWINGLYYGGAGIGIALSGVALPDWMARLPAEWPSAWLLLGGIALVFWPVATLAAPAAQASTQTFGPSVITPLRPILPAFITYLCFALGYIGYMTFIVALLRANGGSGAAISIFWAALGCAAVAAPFVWGRLIERHNDGKPLAVLMTLLSSAALLPLLTAHPAVMLLSGVLFGGSFLSVVSGVTTLTRKLLPATEWQRGVAAATIVFAAGQCVGPLLTGVISDWTGGLTAGLTASAAILLLGALIALRQRPVR